MLSTFQRLHIINCSSGSHVYTCCFQSFPLSLTFALTIPTAAKPDCCFHHCVLPLPPLGTEPDFSMAPISEEKCGSNRVYVDLTRSRGSGFPRGSWEVGTGQVAKHHGGAGAHGTNLDQWESGARKELADKLLTLLLSEAVKHGGPIWLF